MEYLVRINALEVAVVVGMWLPRLIGRLVP
ncbi:MAG: hypothetical protein QOF68_681 [Gaiellales bacterium]|jgi:hypothetical protein|nr:hypothetical protein [Gaiellales bacterium]